jgi:hypothetical protein
MKNKKIFGLLPSLGNPLKRFGSLCGSTEKCEKINDKQKDPGFATQS